MNRRRHSSFFLSYIIHKQALPFACSQGKEKDRHDLIMTVLC